MTTWIFNWQKNGWRSAAKKAVANQDLWEKLAELSKGKKINYHYVVPENVYDVLFASGAIQ